jgi:hypothetical protein
MIFANCRIFAFTDVVTDKEGFATHDIDLVN